MGRCGKAKGVVQALRLVALKLALKSLTRMLCSAPIAAWLASSKWSATSVKEALPLPLFAVVQLERALDSCEPGAWWPLVCFLLMLWAGLRWSDAQRLDFESVMLDSGSIRGWSWRTKTSAVGMPRGALCRGACASYSYTIIENQLAKQI